MRKVLLSILVIVLMFGLASCDFINGIIDPDGSGGLFSPAYVGEWQKETSLSRATYTLTSDSYEMLYEMKVDGSFQNLLAVKGTLTVSGNAMEMIATHKKDADSEGILPADWTEMTSSESEENSGTGTWSVSGDELTMTDDNPEEGQTATQVYTKVE